MYYKNMNDQCMLWAGALTKNGYARVSIKVDGKWTNAVLHRQLYLVEKGNIPEGLVLDHLCRHRHCLNTDHLEPVSTAENLRRGIGNPAYGTHCNNGHLLSQYGVYISAKGSRICKQCNRDRAKARYKSKTTTLS